MTGNVFRRLFLSADDDLFRKVPAQLRIKPLLQNIDVKPLLAAFKMPEKFTGRLSFDGDLRGTGYDRGRGLKQLAR